MYELICAECPDQPTARNRNNSNNTSNNRNDTLLLQHSTNVQSSSSVHQLQLGVMLTQANNVINLNWILLDTCSTDSVFNNNAFLTDITKCEDSDILHIVSNGGGAVTYDTTGFFELLGMQIHYNKNSLANVLSFKQVAALDGVKITLDTSVEKAITVHINGDALKFKECQDGLYFLDMVNLKNKNKNGVNNYSKRVSSSKISNFCLLNTVKNNKSFYSKKQIKMADVARKLQQNMGFPGNEVFKRIIQNNLIKNCPITVEDFKMALKIYGTSESILKCRMTAPSQTSHHVVTASIPQELKNIHKNIQFYVDLCYINGLAFMIVISNKINYISIDYMKNKKMVSIIKHL